MSSEQSQEARLRRMYRKLCDAAGLSVSDFNLKYVIAQVLVGGEDLDLDEEKTVQHFFQKGLEQQKARLDELKDHEKSEEDLRTLTYADVIITEEDLPRMYVGRKTALRVIEKANPNYEEIFLRSLIIAMRAGKQMVQDEIDVAGEIFRCLFHKDIGAVDNPNFTVPTLYEWWTEMVPEVTRVQADLSIEYKLLICGAISIMAEQCGEPPRAERLIVGVISKALGLDSETKMAA